MGEAGEAGERSGGEKQHRPAARGRRQVDVQGREPEHRDEHVVAGDAGEVEEGDAGELRGRCAEQPHREEQRGGEEADGGAEQAAPEGVGQQQRDQAECDRLEAGLQQAEPPETVDGGEEQRMERGKRVGVTLHAGEAGEQVGPEHALAGQLQSRRGLPRLVLVYRRHGGEVA